MRGPASRSLPSWHESCLLHTADSTHYLDAETQEDVMKLDRFSRKMQEGRALTYVILWMLGVPASILFLFFILGIGR
jgi:hypothetical protein